MCTYSHLGAVRSDERSQTKWARLNGLSPVVNTTRLPLVWSACSQATQPRADTLHSKLPASPTQAGWSPHIHADGFLHVCLPYIPWFLLTAADVSQLAQRPNLNKGRLSQVGHMSSWGLQSLRSPWGPSGFCLFVLNFCCHWVLWPVYFKVIHSHEYELLHGALCFSSEILRGNGKWTEFIKLFLSFLTYHILSLTHIHTLKAGAVHGQDRIYAVLNIHTHSI